MTWLGTIVSLNGPTRARGLESGKLGNVLAAYIVLSWFYGSQERRASNKMMDYPSQSHEHRASL